MSGIYRIVTDGAAPDGLQIADERGHLLWNILNAFDVQVHRIDHAVDKLTTDRAHSGRAATSTRASAAHRGSCC